MRFLPKLFFPLILILGFILTTHTVSAHEAYVLTKDQFNAGMQVTNLSAFSALQNLANLSLTIEIMLGIGIMLLLGILFWRSHWGRAVDQWLRRIDWWGPLSIRLAISASLLASALTSSFLGPELDLNQLPLAWALQIALATISLMILFGLLTELAAAMALVIFSLGFWVFGAYLATYLNYFAELVVLLLFGMRRWSVDGYIFGKLKRFKNFSTYEPTLIRIGYGLALIYAAINIKLLHPALTETVVIQYNLTQFHWLFPSDPVLVTLGGALAEITIGLFIIVAFQIRLTILISLFYITLSLIYFREAVWPHLMLYGISISLFLNGGGRITLDQLINRLQFPSLFGHRPHFVPENGPTLERPK